MNLPNKLTTNLRAISLNHLNMKNTKKWLLASCGLLLSSCDIVLLTGIYADNPGAVGGPEVTAEGKFKDSDANWQRFTKRTLEDIHAEKYNTSPGYDWQRAWRASFEAYDHSSENPKREKQYVIKKRREAGLPIWPFMLR